MEYEYLDVGSQAQMFAYNDCLSRAKGKHKWLICMDTDEAIVLKPAAGTHNLGKFLSGYEEHSAIVMQWVIFGSSGHIERPAGGVTRNYVQCSTVNSTQMRGKTVYHYTKLAAQPELVKNWVTAHSARFYNG